MQTPGRLRIAPLNPSNGVLLAELRMCKVVRIHVIVHPELDYEIVLNFLSDSSPASRRPDYCRCHEFVPDLTGFSEQM